MDIEELWCADCNTFVGYIFYAGPHGTVVCGPCGQRRKDEAERLDREIGLEIATQPTSASQ